MSADYVIGRNGGVPFEDGDDRGRIVVPSSSTGGSYSVMEWTVAAASNDDDPEPEYGPHRHGGIEETFFVRSGELEFLVGCEVVVVGPGDFVRVPPGVRHGYRNTTATPVELLVTFVPGGFEEIFVKHRTDGGEAAAPSTFERDAIEHFDTHFE